MEENELAHKDKAPTNEKIFELESALLSLPQIEIPIEHYFAPGIYLRQMTMPKGSAITGKIHKTEHLCILAKGKVTVTSKDGRKTFEAPAVIHSMPGTKRAMYAHEETVWINCHHNPTNQRDEKKIEEIFVTNSMNEFLSFMEQKQIEGGQ